MNAGLLENVAIALLQLPGLEVDRFEQPGWLWLVLLWPILWSLSRLWAGEDDLSELQSQRSWVFRHPLIHLQGQRFRAPKKRRFSWLRLGLEGLRGLLILFLALALAQPEKLEASDPKPQQKTVRDLVFVIESSASLLLPDYRVNDQASSRMQVVQSVLDRFVAGLPGNRFGFTIYAEQAYTLMPLTSDQTAARLYLKRLKPYLAGRTDEAMGEALGLALKETEAGMARNDEKTLKRVVVLISDGLSQPSRVDLQQAISYAQMMNVPIYTIGVGAGSEASDTRAYSGLLYQPLESDSLKRLAESTQGRYFQVGGGDDLQQVLKTIDRLEGVPYLAPPSPPRQIPLYPLPLMAALGLFALYLLLSIALSHRLGLKPEGEV